MGKYDLITRATMLKSFYQIYSCVSSSDEIYVYVCAISIEFHSQSVSDKIGGHSPGNDARSTSVIDYAGKLIRQRLAVIRTQHADPVSPGGESACAHMISRKPAAVYPLSQASPPLRSDSIPSSGYICWIHTHACVTAAACTLDYPMGLRMRNAYETAWHIFGVRESNSYCAATT